MDRDRLQSAFLHLTEVMSRLRKECPWDRKQSHESLRRYLLEECYEVLEAIDHGDAGALREELGDLMFQVWFHAELASEHGDDSFDLAQVLEGITAKLERRHPHVFGDVRADDAETVNRNWEQLKREEGRKSALEGIPRELPALIAAQAMQEKAAAVDFDWPSRAGVVAKVREEVEEFLAELPAETAIDDIDPATRARLDHEFGDLLAALVNYGRHLGITAEDSLRAANRRFDRRFRHMEASAAGEGHSLADLSLDEMERLWQRAKSDG